MKSTTYRGRLAACTIAALAATLAGCGGGGGDGDSGTPAATQVDVAAFSANRLRANAQWALNGTATSGSQSVGFTMNYSLVPGAAGSFPLTGASASTSVETVTLSISGTTQSIVQTLFYDAAGKPIGVSANGTCSITTPAASLPTAATVGQSGLLGSDAAYATCEPPVPAAPISTLTTNWSVRRDANIVFVCQQRSGNLGGTSFDGVFCLESDSAGKLGTRARVTITSSAGTIDARNY